MRRCRRARSAPRGGATSRLPVPRAPPGDEQPEAAAIQRETISLAFITALQLLPPRQRAVIVLCDVLGFSRAEAAGILQGTTDSVASALKRARATLARQAAGTPDREPPPAPGSPAERELVRQLTAAYASGDVNGIISLLAEDVWLTMPPAPFEYQGRDVVGRFCALLFGAGRRFDLVPARANGQPAFGVYVRGQDGISHGAGLYVLTLAGDRIGAMTRFENGVLPWFGLPRSLPGR